MLVSVLLTGCGLSPGLTSPVPTSPAPHQQTTAASRLPSSPQVQTFLQRLFDAARTGDRRTWTDGVSRLDPVFAARADILRSNLAGLGQDPLQVRLTGNEQALTPDRAAQLGRDARAWQVAVSWRLPGETAVAEHDVWVTVVTSPPGVRLAGLDDGPQPRREAEPVWWRGRVTRIDRADVTLLLGAGQSPARWVALVADSVAAARRHLSAPLTSHQPGRIVVEIPASLDDFAAVLGAAPSTYAETAAVTRPEGPTNRAADRIVVNPALGRQPELERRLTLTHETVHVATGSARSPAPLWAVEGLAEFVAYRSQTHARGPARQRLGHELERNGVPTGWPDDPAFGANAQQADTAYALAWVACDVIARDHSSRALAAFYARLDAGDTVAAAAQQALHTDERTLLASWRAALARIAAASRTG